MFELVEVEFKGRKRDTFRNPLEFPFKTGDLVVVEVEKGEHIGHISYLGLRKSRINPNDIHFNVIRKARPEDIAVYNKLAEEEEAAGKVCIEKVKKHSLPMKLVDTEYQFDHRKLTFYFTADGRVDFRELVKDLAGHFRVRIDLRQIGARDETKRMSGYGVCGLKLCCTTFIDCFHPITTQMAKVQNLSLNPQKLSGCCSRLKCCLKYELDQYLEELNKYPTRESIFKTPRGNGMVDKVDIFNECVYLRFQDGEYDSMTPDELEKCSCIKEGPPIEYDPPCGHDDSDVEELCETEKTREIEKELKEVNVNGSIEIIKKNSSTPFPSS